MNSNLNSTVQSLPTSCDLSTKQDISDILGAEINKAQYFSPIFSWCVVTYTYYTIGRKNGTIWKNLFYVATFGLIANVLDIIKKVSLERLYYFETFIYLNWVSTYFYGLNEWGFVYINFSKIRACVKLLKSKTWNVFIYILLVYVLICRTIITYIKNQEELEDYRKECKLNNSRSSSTFHAMVYIPIGLIELALIICVVEQYLKEKKIRDTTRNELSVLFHSTLARTIMISLIYIILAIIVLINDKGFVEFLRKVFWRIKGIFGIIFLVDLLLLKIDIDQNKISIQKDLLDNKNKFEIIRSSVPNNNRKNSTVSFSNHSSHSNHNSFPNPMPSSPIYCNNGSINRNSLISNVPLVPMINPEYFEYK